MRERYYTSAIVGHVTRIVCGLVFGGSGVVTINQKTCIKTASYENVIYAAPFRCTKTMGDKID